MAINYFIIEFNIINGRVIGCHSHIATILFINFFFFCIVFCIEDRCRTNLFVNNYSTLNMLFR